ncbi:MAG: hypothetical protein ACRELC_08740 [Gemmatimonadota bacterium]
MDSVQERLRYWRETVKNLSLREFLDLVNAALPVDEALSLGTLSNYERPREDGRRRAGPRAEFLVALKRAFPELRLEWLLFGNGGPTELAQRLSAPEGLEAAAAAGPGAAPAPGPERPFATRVLERYPDLELLSPEASALFMGALTRYAMGEPHMALDEERLLDLAGDLRWLLLLPLRFWGFRHAPSYDAFSDYCVGLLHALMGLMPATGQGDRAAAYEGSVAPRLRRELDVEFSG